MGTFILFLAFVGYFGYNFLTLLKKLNVGLEMSNKEEFIWFFFGAAIDLYKFIKSKV